MGASVVVRHFQNTQNTHTRMLHNILTACHSAGLTGTVITFNTVEGKAHASFCREPFPHAPVASQQVHHQSSVQEQFNTRHYR